MLAAVMLAALAGFVLTILIAGYREEREAVLRQKVERQLIKGVKTKFSWLEFVGLGRLLENLQQKIIEAGWEKDPEDMMLVLFALAMLLFVMGIVMGLGLLAVFLPAALFAVFYYFLNAQAKKRIRLTEEEMRYALSEMISSLKVRPNLESAIRYALQNAREPLKTQLQNVLDAVTAGHVLDDALDMFARNTGSTIIAAWADNIRFARQAGTDLAEACMRSMKQIKVKQQLKEEKRVAATTAKSTVAGIVIILCLTIWFMASGNDDFIRAVHTTIGRGVVAYAVISMAAASWYIKKQIDD
ncbi:Bacterial type II secretion system protein F domain protein [Thermincola ferriacetica]|uniref:Bacterial type II secretion system protein F domain protein n=1 Tax=Thermincola ferriacetica TaxID=281456 RepID=A0A0L6W5J0_9FIRM|nr:type II secretion system F family protein [Thermincola ferriacetica]KNZ70359.1 Bacterial type II secretion system protein F domain protein [Thermincola ferriacetica]